jgi:hypothetical protein
MWTHYSALLSGTYAAGDEIRVHFVFEALDLSALWDVTGVFMVDDFGTSRPTGCIASRLHRALQFRAKVPCTVEWAGSTV